MQTFVISLIAFLLLGSLFHNDQEIYYQSSEIRNLNLIPQDTSFYIEDDTGNKVIISFFKDNKGIFYWYRRLNTPVCLTGECKWIDIGIYWYFNGEFLGLEVYDEQLTKTDHSIFRTEDYDKLMSVLSNDWSILREFEREGLLNENYEEIDATSGATKKEIADETVSGAVYTTYTIWHLIHKGEKEQLILLTLDQLKDSVRQGTFINSSEQKVHYFLLDQFASGNITASSAMTSFILQLLYKTKDLYKRELALRALQRLNLNDKELQKQLSVVYSAADMSVKIRIIKFLRGKQIVSPSFYYTLCDDLTKGNSRSSAEILTILKNSPTPENKIYDCLNEVHWKIDE